MDHSSSWPVKRRFGQVTSWSRCPINLTGDAQTVTWLPGAVSLLFRRLKLPRGASLHSLRHSPGSYLLASGVPLPAVSARLAQPAAA